MPKTLLFAAIGLIVIFRETMINTGKQARASVVPLTPGGKTAASRAWLANERL